MAKHRINHTLESASVTASAHCGAARVVFVWKFQ